MEAKTLTLVERLRQAEREGLAMADAGYGTEDIAALYGEAATALEAAQKALEPFADRAVELDSYDRAIPPAEDATASVLQRHLRLARDVFNMLKGMIMKDEVLTPSSHGLSAAAAGKTTMDKETDAKMFAAALYVITDMWGKEMGDLQRASLANQIVREIERRGIIQPAAAAEAPSAERVRNNPAPPVQMEAVAWLAVDPGGLTVTTHERVDAEHWVESGWKVTPLYASPVPSSERYPDWSTLHQKIADNQVFLAKGTIEHDGRLAVVDREFMQSVWSALWDLQRAAYAPDGVPSSERDEYRRGLRDALSAVLSLNPTAAAKVAHWAEKEPDTEGRIPFDVVMWVSVVAEQLGFETLEGDGPERFRDASSLKSQPAQSGEGSP